MNHPERTTPHFRSKNFPALVVALIAICGTPAIAGDWPEWRGPNRDAKVEGFKTPAKWPESLTKKWSVAIGGGDASPSLVGDKLYTYTRQDGNEVARCLNAANGKEIWRDGNPARLIIGPPGGVHAGPRSTPTVGKGKVLTLGVVNVFSCYDAASGKLLWRKDEFPGKTPVFHSSMSPIIVDNLAIAHFGDIQAGALIAYDLNTGEEKWRWSGEGPSYGSPVLATVSGQRMIVTCAAKSTIGIDPSNGALLWQVPAPGMVGAAATPVVDGDTVIITGQTGQPLCLKAIKLKKDGDRFTTEEIWTSKQMAMWNTPIIKDGLLVGFGGQLGIPFCLDVKTGAEKWTDPRRLSPYASFLDVGPVIVALTPLADLIVFKPTAEGLNQIASIKVADSETYAHPILTDNRIFIKDQENITLWTIE